MGCIEGHEEREELGLSKYVDDQLDDIKTKLK
jgi:hypothetical protein